MRNRPLKFHNYPILLGTIYNVNQIDRPCPQRACRTDKQAVTLKCGNCYNRVNTRHYERRGLTKWKGSENSRRRNT